MPQLIPGWSQLLGKSSRRRATRRPVGADRRWRRPSFEELERRHLLSVNYFSVGESLDAKLDDMQGRLSTALNFFQTGTTSQIPVIGDQLGRAADIVSSFSDELQLGLQDLGVSANPSDLQIQTVLSARLSSFLNGAGPSGVHVAHAGSNTTIQMLLQGTVDVGGLDINFETGLPSLPIKVLADGEINLTVGYALDLSFTIDANGLVTLNEGSSIAGASSPGADHPIVDANSSLAIFVSAELSSDFSARAIFGFVEGEITPITGTRNGLYATALVSNLTGAPTIKLDGSADANLRMAGSFAGTNGDFPGISTDFHLHWGLSSANPNAGAPTVAFDNVSLTFGTFLSNVLRPALDAVQDAIDPVEPVFDLLGTEVPGISDLSEAAGEGPITMADLAVVGSQVAGYGPLGELAGKVVNVLNTVNSLQLGPNISMPLGGFDLNGAANGDLRSAVLAGDFTNLDVADLTQFVAANLNQTAQGAAQAYHDLVNGLSVSQSIKDELNGLVSLPTANGFKLNFPVLDDPASVVFSMLLGQDSDLFYLEANADVDLEGSRASGLYFAAQPINFVGQAHIDTHFRFGYDTYGLRQLIRNLAAGDASHIVSDITDGFYISDDSYFKMSGSITAEAGAEFFGGAIGITVEGGVYTQNQGEIPVHVYIEDPNGDGKLRFSEFFDTQTGTAAFKTTGVLTAELNISVDFPEIGEDPAYSESINIAQAELITFTTPTPLSLASAPDGSGNITLFLGVSAGMRTGGVGPDGGDETFTIRHVGVHASGGENIRIDAFGLTQIVENVRNIVAIDQIGFLTIDVMPDVTSNVNFAGGSGAALLNYRGKGTATLTGGALASTLIGGPGTNVLNGGVGNDTIILGSGANTVNGGGGHNTIIVKAPIAQNGTIVGGSSQDNTLQIFGSLYTVAMSAVPVGNAVDVGIQNSLAQPGVHLITTNVDEILIHARDSATSFTFGDVSVAGVTELTLNMVSPFPTTRMVDIDTRVGNLPSTIAINDYTGQVEDPLRPGTMITAQGAVIVNSTTGLTTHLFGWRNDDSLVVRHHGGSIDVSALAFTSGNFTFDTTNRLAGQAESISITTPSRVGGIDLVMTNSSGDVLIATTPYLDFRIKGSTPLDSLNLYVSAATSGANTLTLNASSVKGVFTVHALGTAAAINHIRLSHVGPQADVSILGQSTTTDLIVGADQPPFRPNPPFDPLIGTGQLQLIRHDVFASNVQLTIDNTNAPLANILTLNETTFGEWLVPALGTLVQLNFSNLRGEMQIFAGAGDRFQLDVTPPSITGLTMRNASAAVQDLVYIATWAVPLALIGNFSLFAGQRIYSNGTVERLKRLANINAAVSLIYMGNGPSQVVLDGEIDPPDAQYTIDGRGVLHALNQTVGLDVVITGYREVDTLYIYMTGASVAANLQRTSAGKIYFDGQARLTGTDATASNMITIDSRYGNTTLTPLGQYNSLLDMFNDVYVLGAMSQDSLTVNVPTNVRMTAAIANEFNLTYNPNSYAVVVGASPNSLISWLEGPRPGFFVFMNVDAASWSTYYGPGTGHGDPPNPFAEQPYGIDIPHVDGFIEVQYWYYTSINGVQTLVHDDFEGTARYWDVDPNPVAVDNDVQLNASQLRGDFQFNVTGPDYDYIKRLEHDSFSGGAVTQSVAYSAPFHTWGTPYDFMRIAFGESDIVLSHVNPELSVGINSENKNFVYPNLANDAYSSVRLTVVGPYALTKVNVGAGVLANVHGNVTVDQVQLEVDDRNATLPNILALTSSTLAWTSASGTHPTMTVSRLRNDLTLTGGVADRFAVEGVPAVEGKLLIRNFAPAVAGFTAPGVYVMGMAANQQLVVNGNLELYVGHRLNADGSVSAVGDVGQVARLNLNWPNTPTYNGISYTYTGLGKGTFVYDASHTTVPFGYAASIKADPFNANRTALLWGYTDNYPSGFVGNKVDFAGNTEFHAYAPSVGFANAGNQYGITIDNRSTPASVHYVSNPMPWSPDAIEYIEAFGSLGPLFIQGRGGKTLVSLAPGPAAFDIRNTHSSDVTVSNATLKIDPTRAGATPPGVLPQLVMTDTQLTGLVGGTIYYSDLKNYTGTGQILVGLHVGLPHYGAASLTILGTPTGHDTAINTVNGTTIGPTTVLGTNGPVTLGRAGVSWWNGFIRDGFATQSLTIGDGDLQDIRGNISFGMPSQLNFTATGGVVIDNHSDIAGRNAEFAFANFNTQLEGLSAGWIGWYYDLPTQIDFLGAVGTHYTLSMVSKNLHLYAGTGSTVDVFRPTSPTYTGLPNATIYGADSVHVKAPANMNLLSGVPLTVLPDPDRPNQTTSLTVDYSVRTNTYTLGDDGAGLGRISTGSGSSIFPEIRYQADRTHLSITNGQLEIYYNEINILNTPAINTVIDSNRGRVNVLGTTNPLELHHDADLALKFGNAGNMQNLLGSIIVDLQSTAAAPAPVQFNDSADSLARNIVLAHPAADDWTISGMSPTPIAIHGSQAAFSFMGGSGNNALIGPDETSTWLVNGANSGMLNRRHSFSGMRNIVSGSANDTILFRPGGTLAGNLDGGAGTDTLYYQTGMLTGADVINLPAGIAPRVSGQALNLESSGSFAAPAVTNPGSKQFQAGAPITPFTVATSGCFGTRVFSATNLPPGISINSATGTFSGTPTNEVSSYFITVTVTDDTGTLSTNFSWQSQLGILIPFLPSRTSQVNEPINLQVTVQNAYGTTLTFSATNLPAGLSIHSQTGLISGTIAEGAQNQGSYITQIQATDGTHTGTQSFFWTVQKQFIVLNPGTVRTPSGMPFSLQMQAINSGGPVTWSATGMPQGLSINAQTGLISGTLAGYAVNANLFPNVTARDTSNNVLRSASFTINVLPGFSTFGLQNRNTPTGSDIGSQSIFGFPQISGATVVATGVTGLPPGLTYDPVLRVMTGTIDGFADLNSPYNVDVTFLHTHPTYTYAYTAKFTWTVTPSIVLGSPGDQSNHIGDAVDVAIPVLREFGQPLTFSATGLPLGLSINPQTGHITGTVAPQTASNWNGEAVVSATDGANSSNVRFNWNVSQSAANVVQLADPLNGGTITLTSPAGTSLAASISSPGDVGFPLGIECTSSFIGITLTGLQNGAEANVSIVYSSPASATEYYVYGQAPEGGIGWYNFLYQPQSGATGAEFVSSSEVILHLLDGGRGDSDQVADGAVTMSVSAPAVTRLTLLAPDTVHSLFGDTINLPIEYIYPHGNLTFTATGLLDGISINPATGVISGTVAENQLRGYRTVTISATDGVSSSQIEFGWIIPSFEMANIGMLTIPEGAPINLPLLMFATDPTDISFSVSGLPVQFYVDSYGILRGQFNFDFQNTGSNGSYTVHVDANYGFEYDSIEFTINTIPGFSITGVDDRRNWVGAEVDSQIAVSSPYSHQLIVSVTGLPPGLTIDENLAIHGTIENTAAITTTNHVMATVENETLGYTHTVNFDWIVRRIPTAEELNAGTPAGTPELAGILDPTEQATLYLLQGITYAHGATEHTVVYFLKYGNIGSEVWQIDTGALSRVSDVDPNNAVGQYVYDIVSVSDRGILFFDSNSKLWFADETGARVVASNVTYFSSKPITSGDSAYVVVANSSFVNLIIRLQFGETGTVTETTVAGSAGAGSVAAFAGGIVFEVLESSVRVLKWMDAADGATRTVYTAAPGWTVKAIGAAPGPGGTQNFFFTSELGNQTAIRVLNSAEWENPTPVTTLLATVGQILSFPKIVGDKLVFLPLNAVNSIGETRVWITDATIGGAHSIGSPFVGYSSTESVTEVVVAGSDVYLLYIPVVDFEVVNETTLAAQIWKLDTITESLTMVADFYGRDFADYPPHDLVAAGDSIFFIARNPALNSDVLWVCGPGSGASVVEPKASNGYLNPQQFAFVNGSLYFAARSEAVTDLDGNPTNQPWVIDLSSTPEPELPGDFNHDNTVDARDYVVWRKSGGSAADYSRWRANFGRSLPVGGGSGVSEVIASAGTEVSSSSPTLFEKATEVVVAPSTAQVSAPIAGEMVATLTHDSDASHGAALSSPLDDLLKAVFDTHRADEAGTDYKVGFARVGGDANTAAASSRIQDLLLDNRQTPWIDEFLIDGPSFASTARDEGEVNSSDFGVQAIDEVFADLALTF